MCNNWTYLDLLSKDGLAVHFILGGVGVLLPVVSDEGVPLAGVVHVTHHAELLEFLLDFIVGHGLVNSVDEKFGHLVCWICRLSLDKDR